VRVVLAAQENPVAPAVQVALVVLENQAVRAAQVALENPVAPAVQAALVVLENQAVLAVRVELAVLENPVAPAALARLAVAALVNQVEVVEKEAQTRSVAISRRRVAAAGVLLRAAVGALLKPRVIAAAVA
jgi:hypothetical protein